MKRLRAVHVSFMIATAVLLSAQMSAELTVRGCRRSDGDGVFGTAAGRSPLSLVVGRLEELVGDVLLLKADNYFHGQTSLLGSTRVGECHAMYGGVGELDGGEHEHHDGEEYCSACGQDDEHDHVHEHDAAHGLSYNHFLYRQYVKVAPTAHVHIHRSEEIVPWLYASVRFNPGNERAALVTAYWLSQQLGRPEQAEGVLRAALAKRPSSWRLHAELAWLHYRQGRTGPALRQCASALQLFEPGEDAEQARLDLAGLWRLAGACQERLGNLDRAVACARQVVELLPDSEPARHRLEDLLERLDGSRAGADGGTASAPAGP
jgi:tetratricopeptide (TPR) repeat protein